MFASFDCCVLSGRGLFRVGLITRPEETCPILVCPINVFA